MINHLHPSVALDMHKIETRQRMQHLEHRVALAERRSSNAPAPRARVQTVRRATVALAGAGLALTALAMHFI
jgi:hypothetical protein